MVRFVLEFLYVFLNNIFYSIPAYNGLDTLTNWVAGCNASTAASVWKNPANADIPEKFALCVNGQAWCTTGTPTDAPSSSPINVPTSAPTIAQPTMAPVPTLNPTLPTNTPSESPTVPPTARPTFLPTVDKPLIATIGKRMFLAQAVR